MMHELATTTAFNGVVSALVQIADGKVELRKHVAAYVIAGGTVKQLHEELKALDDKRCHKSLSYLKNVQTDCFQVGMLERSEKAKQYVKSHTYDLPVENPDRLSELLPTQRDVKAFAKAPVEVRHQVVDIANIPESFNDKTVEKVRELINPDNYSIDTTSLTDEEKDECLLEQNTRIEALAANAAFNDQACAAAMQEYGFINSDGFWQDHKPLTIIKNLLPELSQSERQQLIDLLISPIQQ